MYGSRRRRDQGGNWSREGDVLGYIEVIILAIINMYILYQYIDYIWHTINIIIYEDVHKIPKHFNSDCLLYLPSISPIDDIVLSASEATLLETNIHYITCACMQTVTSSYA